MGCYLHGLFAADGFRQALLARLRGAGGHRLAYEAASRRRWTAWPAHLERCLDLDRLLALARGG